MNPGLDDNEICMTSTMSRKLDRQNVCYGDAGSPLIGEVRHVSAFYSQKLKEGSVIRSKIGPLINQFFTYCLPTFFSSLGQQHFSVIVAILQ